MIIQRHQLGRWELNDGYKRHYFDSQQEAQTFADQLIIDDRRYVKALHRTLNIQALTRAISEN